VAALRLGQAVWCAGRVAVVQDRAAEGQRLLARHASEITCLAAHPGGELLGTADRVGTRGVWRGGAAAALVWNGLSGRLVACVPALDGADRLGPVVAMCFAPPPARLGSGSRAGAVGLVLVTCEGPESAAVRVYSVPCGGTVPGQGQGPAQAEGDAGEVGVGAAVWVGWARCRMVYGVAAAGAEGGAEGDGLCVVTAGKRHVRCVV
jgi:hypothetical protein